MLPIPNPISIFAGFVGGAVGWAWDKVVQGIFTWFAQGLLLAIDFVWGLLDTATTPRLTDDWFVNGLVATLAPIALFVTVAMMLMTAIQAGLSGRPELIVDSVVSAVRAVFATAMTVVVMDTLIRFGDLIADAVWVQARPNTREVLDGLVAGVLGGDGWGATFLGPLAVLLGMIGMVVTTILLFMRSTLLYLVAAFAPLVWSSSVFPMMRGGVRRMVHLTVALVLAKPAIVISLAIGMQLIASAGGVSGDGGDVAGVGAMLTGFFCFAVASISPWVVYKLLPAAEGAAVASGVVGGWARGAMTATQAAMMAKSMGATRAASAATKAIPSASGEGGGGFSPPSSGGGGAGGAGGGTSGPSGGAATSSAGGGAATSGGTAAGAGAAAGPAAPVVAGAAVASTAAKSATTAASTTSTASTASTSSTFPSATAPAAGSGEARATTADSGGDAQGPTRRVVITSSRSSGRGADDSADGDRHE